MVNDFFSFRYFARRAALSTPRSNPIIPLSPAAFRPTIRLSKLIIQPAMGDAPGLVQKIDYRERAMF